MKFYYEVGKTVCGPFVLLDTEVFKTAGFEPGDRLEVNVEEGGHRFVVTKAKQTFNARRWAQSILKKYSADYYWEDLDRCRCIAYEKVAPIGKKSKFGFAQCHPNDMYDACIGGAVAICRAEGIPLPNELTSSNVYRE